MKAWAQKWCCNRALLACCILLAAGSVASAQPANSGAWPLIAPFFQPPAAFSNQFGSYRSPLLFTDGSRVRLAEDWSRRRAEIRREWMELMGPWPPIIEKPKVEILQTSRRGNFTQHRVQLEIAPQQTGEGWLLVPEGKGPFPAVLVVFYEPETSVGLNTNQFRDFGYQLARRGFVTLNIGTPELDRISSVASASIGMASSDLETARSVSTMFLASGRAM